MVRRWDLNLLFLIILVTIILRFVGISFGFPYIYNLDEAVIVNHALAFGTGDLNPHYFLYPTLYMYVMAMIYGLIYITGKVFGVFASTNDLVRIFFNDVTMFYLPGRLLAAVSGVLSVAGVFFLGRRLYESRVGLVAAAFLSVSQSHVGFSQMIKTHVPSGFFGLLAIWFAASIYRREAGWRSYILGGIFSGLAASTIYHGGFVIFALMTAHFLTWRKNHAQQDISIIDKKIVSTVIFAMIAFFAGTPYALLDWKFFLHDLSSSSKMFNTAGLWEFGFLYPVLSLKNFGNPLGYFIFIGLIYAIIRHRHAELILISQPIAIIALLMCFSVKQSHHMLVTYPALSILAAVFIVEVSGYLNIKRHYKDGLLIIVVLLIISNPLKNSWDESYRKTLPDTRTIAKEWIEMNIGAGATIAMDSGKYYLSKFGPPLRMSDNTLMNLIERGSSIPETDTALFEGTRRRHYSGESAYFQKQLEYTDRNSPSYNIIQIIHNPSDPESVYIPELKRLKEIGVQYIIINESQLHIYDKGSEFDKFHSQEAMRYRDFYDELKNKEILLKEFNSVKSHSSGPTIYLYKISPIME